MVSPGLKRLDAALTAVVFLFLAFILVSCQTKTPAPARATAACDAYATVLPVHVSRRDTEPTKKSVFRVNSLHVSLCGE